MTVTGMIAQSTTNIPSFALLITVLAAVSGCSSNPPDSAAHRPAATTVVQGQRIGERAAAVALDQVGVPYRYGGATTRGFDCSGLVQYSYGKAGKTVPRTTGQLWSAMQPVERHELQAGDVLFFRIEGKMSHVGLYVGQQTFVHAPSSGRTVSVQKLTAPYYSAAFIRAGRPR